MKSIQNLKNLLLALLHANLQQWKCPVKLSQCIVGIGASSGKTTERAHIKVRSESKTELQTQEVNVEVLEQVDR
mgnify:CR=1 FL=1